MIAVFQYGHPIGIRLTGRTFGVLGSVLNLFYPSATAA
jgi:hypothetical protein